MNKIWRRKKQTLLQQARDCDARSPVFELLSTCDDGDEWRLLGQFKFQTLIVGHGQIERAGPVLVGVCYHARQLAEAPHPFEMVTILSPAGIFHPNITPAGAFCLGHPKAGLSLTLILHQVWAGLTFNMSCVNTTHGDVANANAAQYVRENTDLFPLSNRGLFETGDAP